MAKVGESEKITNNLGLLEYDGATWRLYLNGNLERQLPVGLSPRSDSLQHAGVGAMLSPSGARSESASPRTAPAGISPLRWFRPFRRVQRRPTSGSSTTETGP